MKKIDVLILIFTFIDVSFCEELCALKSDVSKKSDCTDVSLSSIEKTAGLDSCCYMTYKDSDNEEQKECIPMKKKEVTNDWVKNMEKEYEASDLKVDCNSKWLKFSMMIFGLFVLLF